MTPERKAELRQEVADCLAFMAEEPPMSGGVIDETSTCPTCPVQTELLDEIDRLEALAAMRSKALDALGHRWRMDWSDFDGRTLRAQLYEVNDIDTHDKLARFVEGQRGRDE